VTDILENTAGGGRAAMLGEKGLWFARGEPTISGGSLYLERIQRTKGGLPPEEKNISASQEAVVSSMGENVPTLFRPSYYYQDTS